MANGMTGHLLELSRFLTEDNGWLGTEKEGWETEPYWLRGFHDLGILTGDRRIRREAAHWIEAVISTRCEDGYFGPRTLRSVVGKNGIVVCDLWPHMIMIDALRSHWETTKDERIPSLLLGFFRFCGNLPAEHFLPAPCDDFGGWAPFWQRVRAGDMLPHIYWTYNLTGEECLLDVATRFHEHVSPPEGPWLNVHGVNFAQRFREPATYYVQSRNPRHLEETEYWYRMHMAEWGEQPRGAFGADETVRPGKTDPKQGTETCTLVELAKSFYNLGQITGRTLYADRVEDILFNHFPAAQTPDLKGLHYFTAANQPQLDASANHDYQSKARVLDYSPHAYWCCQHNVSMGWPYYAEHLWMAAPGNGLAAWLYGSCSVTSEVGRGEKVCIREETDYPFDTSVRMTVSAEASVEFPLYLRIPGWCNGFAARVNGRSIEVPCEPGRYLVIEREWQDGDLVDIAMPTNISVHVWEKHARAVTVDRGPLSYSLKIGEDWRSSRGGMAAQEWPEWEVFPTTPWNYGLSYDSADLETSFQVLKKGTVADQPWASETAPIEIRTKGKRIPNWAMVDETVTDLQPSPVKSGEPMEEITLIPMGCAHLRMSVLPVIGEGPNAREWVRVTSHGSGTD
jgi:hypothetical protein